MADAVAGRLKRPALRDPRLLVGIVLIAVSVAGVLALLRQADTTIPVYAAVGTLPAGTVVAPGDVTVTEARVDPAAYVAGADDPIGMVLMRTVGAGELVPAQALVTSEDFSSRPVAVTTTLALADSIVAGSLVDVWLTTLDDDDAPTSVIVGEGLVVQSVAADDAAFGIGSEQTVQVVVPSAEVGAFLDALATAGDISVVGIAGTS